MEPISNSAVYQENSTVHIKSHSGGKTLAIYPDFIISGEYATFKYEDDRNVLIVHTFDKKVAPRDAFKIRPASTVTQSGRTTRPYITFAQIRHLGFKYADGIEFDTVCNVQKTVGGMRLEIKLSKSGSNLYVLSPNVSTIMNPVDTVNLPIITTNEPTPSIPKVSFDNHSGRLVVLDKEGFIEALNESMSKLKEFTIDHYGQQVTFRVA